jgi:hypothetical protein
MVKTTKSTSKQHRKLKCGVQYYFNQNKEMKKEKEKLGPPPTVAVIKCPESQDVV